MELLHPELIVERPRRHPRRRPAHLKPFFGEMRLDRIRVAEVAQFRASLVEKGLKPKTVNNLLGVLSKPLRYAADVDSSRARRRWAS
jgi:hypothetical protein